MPIDLSMDLIQVTVQVAQPVGENTRTVGTGFLISDPTPDGKARVVLVTANHVLRKMPGPIATVGFRIENADGTWRYDPEPVRIRDAAGHELWTHHPDRDVAVISIAVPPAFAKAAVPLDWLAGDETFGKYDVGPGDEMMTLGFPKGLSSTTAGFPILRSGRVASYPLGPSSQFPTFLLDFNVFPGDSGGPVYMSAGAHRRPSVAQDQPVGFIAGIVTQQVELDSQSLLIGIVTQARFIRETLTLMDKPAAEGPTFADAPPPAPATAAVEVNAVTADDAAHFR